MHKALYFYLKIPKRFAGGGTTPSPDFTPSWRPLHRPLDPLVNSHSGGIKVYNINVIVVVYCY